MDAGGFGMVFHAKEYETNKLTGPSDCLGLSSSAKANSSASPIRAIGSAQLQNSPDMLVGGPNA
jgi:hypothetical protein